MASEYRLIPADVPEKSRHKKGLYDRILDDFLTSDAHSVRVEVTGKSAVNITLALRRAAIRGAVSVLVNRRGDQVYLVRKS